MKASCASVNFDFFMPKTPSQPMLLLEFSRKDRSRKPEAGQVMAHGSIHERDQRLVADRAL
jgi:hypothetical protein